MLVRENIRDLCYRKHDGIDMFPFYDGSFSKKKLESFDKI